MFHPTRFVAEIFMMYEFWEMDVWWLWLWFGHIWKLWCTLCRFNLVFWFPLVGSVCWFRHLDVWRTFGYWQSSCLVVGFCVLIRGCVFFRALLFCVCWDLVSCSNLLLWLLCCNVCGFPSWLGVRNLIWDFV